jgi:exosortase
MPRKGRRWARPNGRSGKDPSRTTAVPQASPRLPPQTSPTAPARPAAPIDSRFGLLALVALGGSILWAYWPTLVDIQQRWWDDPQYSHGFLVPVFAGTLLWLRRANAPQQGWRFSGWGIALLLAGCGLRLAAVYLYLNWLEGISLLLTLAGMAVFLGGWPLLRWSWPAIAFLFFMVPLPYRVQTALAYPLQRAATEVSTFVLQTLGLPALAEGNVILLEDVRIGVVEACSGLTMMMTFFALATALILVRKRPLLDRAVILLSAGPIAILANVTRITVTGVLHEVAGSEVANAVFHDWAGWLMMPVALGLLALVLKVLSHLLVVPASKDAALRSLFGVRLPPRAAPVPAEAAAPAPSAAL